MSQEINLLNPELRPRRDWLAFRPVAALALLVLVLLFAAWAWASWQLRAVTAARVAGEAGLLAAQQSLQAAQGALARHVPSAQLTAEAERLGADIARRNFVLQRARETVVEGNAGLADVMRGFSRQIMEGVWLTGFASNGGGLDIRGRLLDPGLLPAYIRRLNDEPAFRGRRFATLDMRDGALAEGTDGGAPAPANTAGGGASLLAMVGATAPDGGATQAPAAASATGSPAAATAASPPASIAFTEFALRARAVPANGGKE
jgi:hypothetical protein